MTAYLRSLAGLLAAASAFATPIDRAMLTSEQLGSAVPVQNVSFDGTSVVGDVVNRTGYTIGDLRLVAADSFRWANERSPGTDDPSRATTITVPGPIPPDARVTVRAPLSPRPPRADGYFVPRMHVVSVVRIENPQ